MQILAGGLFCMYYLGCHNLRSGSHGSHGNVTKVGEKSRKMIESDKVGENKRSRKKIFSWSGLVTWKFVQGIWKAYRINHRHTNYFLMAYEVVHVGNPRISLFSFKKGFNKEGSSKVRLNVDVRPN